VSNTTLMALIESYRKSLDDARSELESLMEQREEIDLRISQLKQAIVALAPLGEDEDSKLSMPGFDLKAFRIETQAIGITDACREILKTAGSALTPLEVKARLIQMKPEFDKQKNLMASVHSVLKRLVKNNEAATRTTSEGDVVYKWIRRFRRFHVRRGRATVGDVNAPVKIGVGEPPVKEET